MTADEFAGGHGIERCRRHGQGFKHFAEKKCSSVCSCFPFEQILNDQITLPRVAEVALLLAINDKRLRHEIVGQPGGVTEQFPDGG